MFTTWDELEDGLSGIKGLQKKAAKGDADAARKLEKKAAKKAAQSGGGSSSAPSGGSTSSPVSMPAPPYSTPSGGSSDSSIGSLFGSIPPIVLYGGLAVIAFLMFRKSGK